MGTAGAEYIAISIEKDMKSLSGQDVQYEDWIIGIGSVAIAWGILEPNIYPSGTLSIHNETLASSKQVAEKIERYFKKKGCRHHPQANSSVDPNFIKIYYFKVV